MIKASDKMYNINIMKLIISGDSHTRIFKHMKAPFSVCLKVRSATTMYRVQRDGIEQLLKDNHARASRELESHEEVSRGDVIFFCYGYVDIINNILKHEEDWRHFVKEYVRVIKEYGQKYGIIPLIQIDTVPQPEDDRHTYIGSLSRRTQLREDMYEFLKSETIKEGICGIDLYNKRYDNEQGQLSKNMTYSQDNAHIGHNSSNANSCKGCELCTGKEAKYIWSRLLEKIPPIS